MIKDLYFIDLAKSSQVLLTLLLHLPMDDSHFGCPPKKKKILKKNHCLNLHIIQTPHEQIISQACKIIVILSISNFTTHFQTPLKKTKKNKKPISKVHSKQEKIYSLYMSGKKLQRAGKKSGRHYGQEQGRKTGRNKGQENEQEHGQ
jgi:hypothetical protein